MGGKFDLALQEYGQLLRWYGNTELAPNAQYYVAWIHASQGDYESAVKEYDMVLEKYPDNNNKMPDAFYGKGLALAKSGPPDRSQPRISGTAQAFPQQLTGAAGLQADRFPGVSVRLGPSRLPQGEQASQVGSRPSPSC